MNADIKKKWIEALLSGKFRQGQYVLRSKDDRFCCLGVLAEVCQVPKEQNSYGNYAYIFENGASLGGYLPLGFRGLSEPEIGILARMNDQGISFTEIAAYIKRSIKTGDSDGTDTD